MQVVTLAEAEARLSALVDQVERERDRVMIAKNGQNAAVLISRAELDSIEETLDVLGDPELMASLRKSRQEAALGRVTDLADLTDLGGNPLPVPPPTGG